MTLQSNSRREFIIKLASVSSALAAGSVLSACGGGSSDGPMLVFNYGVASGDPLSDRVILWTHACYDGSIDSVNLTYQVATDASFATIVSTGTATASASTGFTAKADATGLTAGSSYYYRFIAGRWISPVGFTRTLPAANVASVKFAVFSCTLYSAGYFNVYDDASKSGAQYAVHLGDYIYEYGSDPAKFGNGSAVTLGRVTAPANEIITVDDYRTRYAKYRSDPNLKALHATMPWITVWDDHEFANNSWVDGAENHNSATQGPWATRKATAAQVYHEWMPIRVQDPANLLKIYRRFDFGSIFTLHMVDTRIEGRAKQYDAYGDADGGLTRYATALTTGTDAAHPMMSTTQQSWLTNGMAASTATWQIMGNQDIMARMWFPVNVLQANGTATANPTAANLQAVTTAISDYLTAKATPVANRTATQVGLLNTTLNPRLPYNLDSWDGYPIQRETILQTVRAQGNRLVTLSGDSHNAWFANLTTLAGVKVGVEFAGTSVTSPGFESAGLGGLASSLDGTAVAPGTYGTGLGLVDDLNYVDTIRRGYLLMTVTAASVKGEYVFVDTIASTTYRASTGKTVTVSAANMSVTYA
jgi:alkaline phosphatase D